MLNIHYKACKIKPYKVQEMVFSCLRSKIAYGSHKQISNMFKKHESYELLLNCNTDVQTKVNTTIDTIIDTMDSEPIFYDSIKFLRESHGYIIWKSNTIYVTFRGSNDLYDILNSLDIRPTYINDARIHTGFLCQFNTLKDKITLDLKEIINKNPIERIIFAGHSKGGSLAAIAATYYGAIFANLHITCHTIGSPMIGDINFIKCFLNNVDDYIRLELEDDLIPKIQINDFVHLPYSIKLNTKGDIITTSSSVQIDHMQVLKCLTNIDRVYDDHSLDYYMHSLLHHKSVRKDNNFS